jgi:hypothetical protein
MNIMINIKKGKKFALAFFISLITFSCLDDKGYTDIINSAGNKKPVVSWYGNLGTSAFVAVALPGGSEPDANYKAGISVTSNRGPIGKDFPVSVEIDESVIDEVNSGIALESEKFTLMPDSTFNIPTLNVIVPDDTTEVEFVVTFHQDKIDKGKNYLLPLRIVDQEGVVIPANSGTLKLSFIGNPLAGTYLWDLTRYNCTSAPPNGCSLSSASFTGESTVFSPVNATSFKVATGYYTQPNYVISFSNNSGVLSNFSAIFDPKDLADLFTANSVTVTDGPTITVNEDYTIFTVHYSVFNGTAYRDLTDVYYK